MSLAAHFQDKTANFADLDLGTARELIDSPAEVSELDNATRRGW